MSNLKWAAISLIVPSLIVVLGVQCSYWFSARSSLRDIELLYIFAAVIAGILCFNKLIIESKYKKALFWFLYLLLMSQIVFWGSLLTACANGDCL